MIFSELTQLVTYSMVPKSVMKLLLMPSVKQLTAPVDLLIALSFLNYGDHLDKLDVTLNNHDPTLLYVRNFVDILS